MTSKKIKAKPITKADLNKVQTATPNYTEENKKIPQDFYIQPITRWTVDGVAAALDTHDRGQFTTSGRLADTILRDARVTSVINTRVLGVLGLPFSWKFPEDYNPTAKDKAALEVTKKYWKDMVDQALLATILKNVVMMGFCVCSIYWEQVGDMYLPRITPFHPSNIQFNISSWQFMAYTLNQGTTSIDPNNPNWIVFCQLDKRRPWLNGVIRALSFPWLQKTFALADWRGFNAVHGQPIRKLKMPVESGTPPEEDPQNFIQAIAQNARLGAPVLLPNGADLELMQASSQSSDTFKDQIEQANIEIAIAVLGQNLTTDSGSKAGSYALGKIHRDIMLEYLEADTHMLNETLHRELLHPFYAVNFGSEPEYMVPYPVYDSTPPEDQVEKAKIMASTSESLVKLADTLQKVTDLGLIGRLDVDKLLLQYNLPLKSNQ